MLCTAAAYGDVTAHGASVETVAESEAVSPSRQEIQGVPRPLRAFAVTHLRRIAQFVPRRRGPLFAAAPHEAVREVFDVRRRHFASQPSGHRSRGGQQQVLDLDGASGQDPDTVVVPDAPERARAPGRRTHDLDGILRRSQWRRNDDTPQRGHGVRRHRRNHDDVALCAVERVQRAALDWESLLCFRGSVV